ncbi:OLC1v1031604C1 [Oldenlandia corymbosa var. corymbosa]|uniref:OLC1v1031604C1 n=1 Tax=Oldenlandia corymbosa var. corymbosa TaxID=529605 RepID=A0AAV1CJP4_OLDCO|nr:OLC1v1031604C1 [Oldenlandia corymbosa var. corymbosa]
MRNHEKSSHNDGKITRSELSGVNLESKIGTELLKAAVGGGTVGDAGYGFESAELWQISRRQHRSGASVATTSNGSGRVRRISSEWVFRSSGGTKACVFGEKGKDGFGFGTGSSVLVLFCTCPAETQIWCGRSATINMVEMNSKEMGDLEVAGTSRSHLEVGTSSGRPNVENVDYMEDDDMGGPFMEDGDHMEYNHGEDDEDYTSIIDQSDENQSISEGSRESDEEVRASLRDHGLWEIVKWVPEHNCMNVTEENNNRNVSAMLIAHLIKHKVELDSDYEVKLVQEEVKDRMHVDVPYHRAWEGRRKAIDLVYGDWVSNFDILLRARLGGKGDITYTEKYEEKKCSCKKWQEYRFPCTYALAVCRKIKDQPVNTVNPYFRVVAWQDQFNGRDDFSPVPDMRRWPKVGRRLVPNYERVIMHAGPGRWQKKRFKMQMDYRGCKTKGECLRCGSRNHFTNACPKSQKKSDRTRLKINWDPDEYPLINDIDRWNAIHPGCLGTGKTYDDWVQKHTESSNLSDIYHLADAALRENASLGGSLEDKLFQIFDKSFSALTLGSRDMSTQSDTQVLQKRSPESSQNVVLTQKTTSKSTGGGRRKRPRISDRTIIVHPNPTPMQEDDENDEGNESDEDYYIRGEEEEEEEQESSPPRVSSQKKKKTVEVRKSDGVSKPAKKYTPGDGAIRKKRSSK